MTESRCPFRMKGFDQPDTCDEKCAWLMRVIDYDQRNSRACAMSVIAMRDEMNEWVPANITDVDANDGLAAENDVSAASVDANDGNADTREKLEADAHSLVAAFTDTYSDESEMFSNVIRLLDRQAAITEQRHLELTGAFQLESDKIITKLQARVDELTTERDKLYNDLEKAVSRTDKLIHRLEYDYGITASWGGLLNVWQIENNEHDLLEQVHAECTELQKQVEELTGELAAARNAHAQAEHEAVILREKLGRALDYAHEITSVGGDC